MMSKKWTVYLLGLLFCLFFLEAGEETAVDKRMGTLYLEQARFLLRYGEVDGASDFIKKAAEYIPENQDLRYLSTLLMLRRGLTSEALASAEIQYTGGDPFQREWDRLRLPLFARTKQYIRVRDILQNRRDQIDWDTEELLLFAQALIALEDTPAALALLEEALARYPMESSLLGLLLEESVSARIYYQERLFKGDLLSRERENEVILLLLPLAEADAFPPLWELYRQRGLYSLEGEIRRGELFGWEEELPLGALAGAGLFSDGLLTNRVYKLLLFEEDRQNFESRFNRFTGIMSYDLNHDGWIEAAVSYRDGKAEEILQDFNQDGRPEIAMVLQEGIPVRLSLAAQEARVEYQSYPWVERILHLASERTLRYQMGAERFRLPVEGWGVTFGPPTSGRPSIGKV